MSSPERLRGGTESGEHCATDGNEKELVHTAHPRPPVLPSRGRPHTPGGRGKCWAEANLQSGVRWLDTALDSGGLTPGAAPREQKAASGRRTPKRSDIRRETRGTTLCASPPAKPNQAWPVLIFPVGSFIPPLRGLCDLCGKLIPPSVRGTHVHRLLSIVLPIFRPTTARRSDGALPSVGRTRRDG